MINEHCGIYKVICIYKFSAILKILKSARRSEAPLAVTSHQGSSLVLPVNSMSFIWNDNMREKREANANAT
jgi:hypothetical protein